jgi:hypothetical protein
VAGGANAWVDLWRVRAVLVYSRSMAVATGLSTISLSTPANIHSAWAGSGPAQPKRARRLPHGPVAAVYSLYPESDLHVVLAGLHVAHLIPGAKPHGN